MIGCYSLLFAQEEKIINLMNLITRLHQCSLHLISLAGAKLHFINMWNYSVQMYVTYYAFMVTQDV